MYQAYLEMVSQLMVAQEAIFTIGDREIYLQIETDGTWSISTVLLSQGGIVQTELFPKPGSIGWRAKDHYLKTCHDNILSLFETTPPLKRFIDFRAFFKTYLARAEEFDTLFAS